MTLDSIPMSGLYGSSYAMQNYYNNPYFLQAYKSPNYNQIMQAQQQLMAQQPTNTNGQANPQQLISQQNGVNTSFKGAQSAISNDFQEEKSSNGLAWVLGLTATTIGTAWWLASRGKARNATGLWNQLKLGATSLFNKSTLLKGADIAKNKEALKLNEALRWTDDLVNLKGFQFDLKKADGTIQKFVFNNGEVVTKAYKKGELSEALKKQVDDIVEIIKSKDISKLSPDVTLKNITYTSPLNKGIGFYRAVTPDDVDNLKFVKAYL